RASIKSSLGVNTVPIANAAVKITPIATSVVIVALFCNSQIKIVPSNNVVAAPASGLTLSNIATPSPGRAMCETTSPARLIRFIKAKLPTSPAATEVSNTSKTEYVSAVVTVGQCQAGGEIESLA